MNPTYDDVDLTVCSFCNETVRMADADWCSCVTNDRSLVCKSCGRCFCEATPSWKSAFWGSATPSLLERRRQQQRIGRSSFRAVARAEDKRPLILVVDDDQIVHLTMGRALARFQGSVKFASNGEEGLAMAMELQPDLLITDALLPRLDGRELARAVKLNPATNHCKVVVMSALYKGLRYRHEALREFMVDEYIEKPVSAATLFEILHRLLPETAGATRAGTA